MGCDGNDDHSDMYITSFCVHPVVQDTILFGKADGSVLVTRWSNEINETSLKNGYRLTPVSEL